MGTSVPGGNGTHGVNMIKGQLAGSEESSGMSRGHHTGGEPRSACVRLGVYILNLHLQEPLHLSEASATTLRVCETLHAGRKQGRLLTPHGASGGSAASQGSLTSSLQLEA